MVVDRRLTLIMLLAAAIPGCAKARPKMQASADPYGFRRRFVDPSGRVVDTGNGGISHSEGQGYGMLLAEAEGDHAGFDSIWNWTRKTLMRPDHLFSWRYDPKAAQPVSDPNDAADGDMLIAWALMRAAVRWPDSGYGNASRSIRTAMESKLIVQHGGRSVLLPGVTGFATADHLTLNPSYYVWPALDAFARADGGAWRTLIRDGERLIAQARFGAAGLPTDWIDLGANGNIAPAAGRPPQFGFDAIRVPLYLAWSKRSAAAQPVRTFWSGFSNRKVPIPAWIDVATGQLAPFTLSAGARAIVHLVVPTAPKVAVAEMANEDYYSTVLAALSALASSND
jgi:endo-1,4-beta-D-glucanase Y